MRKSSFVLSCTLIFGVSRSNGQSFNLTGSMNIPRFSHTATLLTDGRILVTGGQGFFGASATSTAEIFNPSTGSWRYTSNPMAFPRYGHTAIRLADGKVLIAGGDNAVIKLNSAEIFDPVTETFTAIAPMTSAHASAMGFPLPDGRVLVLSGDWNTACDLYQPSSGTWSAAAPLPIPLVGPAAALLSDGRVLLAGGVDPGYVTRDSVYIYNPASNVWQTLAPLQQSRQALTLTALPGGKALIAGGSNIFSGLGYTSAEIYDPSAGVAGQSTLIAPMTTPRRGHSAVTTDSGEVLVTGGTQEGVGSLASTEVYNPVGGTWRSGGSMSVGREAHSLTLLNSAGILVAGGIQHNGTFENPFFLQSAEVWNSGCLAVQVDIKPGSSPNTINLGSNGTVPVAILSSSLFDALTVNPLSVTLAGAMVKLKGQGTPQTFSQDVNGDGRTDLVIHVLTEALQLTSTDTQALLRGATFAGQCITGSDTVRVVP